MNRRRLFPTIGAKGGRRRRVAGGGQSQRPFEATDTVGGSETMSDTTSVPYSAPQSCSSDTSSSSDSGSAPACE